MAEIERLIRCDICNGLVLPSMLEYHDKSQRHQAALLIDP
jgi:hypothetical protein